MLHPEIKKLRAMVRFQSKFITKQQEEINCLDSLLKKQRLTAGKFWKPIIDNMEAPSLTEKEKIVLDLHYGFTDGLSRSFYEIGQGLGVTRQRARQICDLAFTKIESFLSIKLVLIKKI